MMKRLFYLLAAMSLIIGCNDPEQEPDIPSEEEKTPELQLNVPSPVNIGHEGGTVDITYTVVNPADDGVVYGAADADWITEVDDSEYGLVRIMVAENADEEGREATVSVIYSYGDAGDTVCRSVDIVQAGYVPEYDYDFEATSFSGEYNGNAESYGGEHEYIISLSDLPLDGGNPQNGGTYYTFYIYTSAPEDMENPLPSYGTYNMGEPGTTAEMTFSDMSYAYALDQNGNPKLDVSFSSGTLSVSEDGDNTLFEAYLTDMDGNTHHVRYLGQVSYVSNVGGGSDEIISEDIDIVPTQVSATYISHTDDIMRVDLSITDMLIDYGYPTPPGNTLHLQVFMPMNQEGNPATGTYRVSASAGDNLTIVKGEIIYGEYGPSTSGSYVEQIVGFYEKILYGAISEGSMTIEGTPGNYSLSCDFTTPEGYHITSEYTGELNVEGVPKPASTLTGDYELNLDGAVGTATCVPDFAGGSFYKIRIAPEGGRDGDVLLIELISEGTDSSAGIASNTYTASSGYSLNQYMIGSVSYGSPYGTFYVGEYDDSGYMVVHGAPAMSGDLVITNHNDGTYTFLFSFLDDIGYTWSGEWTGTISIQ